MAKSERIGSAGIIPRKRSEIRIQYPEHDKRLWLCPDDKTDGVKYPLNASVSLFLSSIFSITK